MEFVPFVSLTDMQPMAKMKDMNTQTYPVANVDSASFLDIFRGLVDNVITTNEQVDRDMIDLMLGNIDNLAEVQSNIEKANMAVELLVTVKNEVVSAYNSIINMQI
ncbi:MAG: flagellar hook-basal body complex protein FliE [Oscillospiraceae bacterium]|nr:flagellar hook-basal body complex protein FliE [Oscillospiraceae bacterium]